MSEQPPPQRPPFDRARSSSSQLANAAETSSTDENPSHKSRPHAHKTKQFVVNASRHHSRVPSYGRNLNKQGKQAPLANSPGKSKGKERLHDEDAAPKAGKKAMFELGDDNHSSSTTTAATTTPSSFKEGYSNGHKNGGLEPATAAALKDQNGLVKSSSARSLEQRSRSRESVHKASTKKGILSGEKRSRSRSKTRDISRIVFQHHKKSSEALADMNTTKQTNGHHHLVPNGKKFNGTGAKLTPQITSESAAANLDTPAPSLNPNNPITPAHSLPNSHDQPLTSRFLEYSSTGASNSISPSSGPTTSSYGPTKSPARLESSSNSPPPETTLSSATTAAANLTTNPIPKVSSHSRTQQKLWLQRASSQADVPAESIVNPRTGGPGSEWYAFQTRAQQEFTRVRNEYMNVRRFQDPVGDGINRIREKQPQRRIPRRSPTITAGDGGGTMGLSRSLGETGVGRTAVVRGLGGSKDDSGVKQSAGASDMAREDGELEVIVKRLWNMGGIMECNE